MIKFYKNEIQGFLQPGSTHKEKQHKITLSYYGKAGKGETLLSKSIFTTWI